MGDVKRAVIFSGAPVSLPLQPPVPDAQLYICADAGLQLAQSLQIEPDWIVGDFDSLGAVPTGNNVMAVSPNKDDTDTILAAKYALSHDCTELIFYGALGGRLDHTIANIQMLRMIHTAGGQGVLVDAHHWVTLHYPGSIQYQKYGTYFSVFAMTPQCEGVTLEGVQYPLNHGILHNDFPLGVSNQVLGDQVTVTLEKGELLLIFSSDET